MKAYSIITMFLIFFVFSNQLTAQSEPPEDSSKVKKIVKVELNDGVIYIGELLQDDGREILLETEKLGKLYISKSTILSITEINKEESLVKGAYRDAGPFTTRYYFTNNALPIKKGEHYAMVHLYGPEVHFAVSDNLSIGVMSTWIASPIGIAAKYSFKTSHEKIHLSLGTIMFSSGYLFQAQGWGGLHWGSVTYGEAGKNITFSTGFGYVDLVQNRRSVFETGLMQMNRGSVSSVAVLYPVGERASFIFDSMIGISEGRKYNTLTGYWYENDFINGIVNYESGTQVSAFLMPGMRFQKKPNRAFQVALAGVIQYSSVGFPNSSSNVISFPAPMCSWFFKF